MQSKTCRVTSQTSAAFFATSQPLGLDLEATSEDIGRGLVQRGEPSLLTRFAHWRDERRAAAHPPGRLGVQVLQALAKPVVQHAPKDEGEPASDVVAGGSFEGGGTEEIDFSQPRHGFGKAVGIESSRSLFTRCL